MMNERMRDRRIRLSVIAVIDLRVRLMGLEWWKEVRKKMESWGK